MVYLIFIAFLLIFYGVMCFLARETLWRLSVPQHARGSVNSATWDRMTAITGILAILLGIVITVTLIQ